MMTFFKLLGLERSNLGLVIASCEGTQNETFKAPISGGPKTEKNIWEICEGDWGNPKLAAVEYDYLENGIPANPVVKFLLS